MCPTGPRAATEFVRGSCAKGYPQWFGIIDPLLPVEHVKARFGLASNRHKRSGSTRQRVPHFCSAAPVVKVSYSLLARGHCHNILFSDHLIIAWSLRDLNLVVPGEFHASFTIADVFQPWCIAIRANGDILL